MSQMFILFKELHVPSLTCTLSITGPWLLRILHLLELGIFYGLGHFPPQHKINRRNVGHQTPGCPHP